LKLPAPKPREPWRSLISKKNVGRQLLVVSVRHAQELDAVLAQRPQGPHRVLGAKRDVLRS